jgi:hypothetical protein
VADPGVPGFEVREVISAERGSDFVPGQTRPTKSTPEPISIDDRHIWWRFAARVAR